MVECLTVPLKVPAHASVVLEGWLEPGARHPEGPFGDHTGFYTPVEPFPALTVDCMTMQAPAVESDLPDHRRRAVRRRRTPGSARRPSASSCR